MLPALAANGLGNIFGLDGFWFHVAEGALRLGIFLGYLLLIGQLKDIKRVFQYHGAEHKAIAAYENDVELTPESAQQFDTPHVRCGTNFLLTVMVITIVVYSFVGRPGWPLLILSRIVLIPLIAGVSYEVIRFAAKHMDRAWVRVLMKPGLAAAEAHHPRADARPGRGGGGVAAGGAHRRAARRGRGPPAASTELERATRARLRVKFGIFYEHQLPRPWEEDSEYTLIQHALEQCELADRLGIDYVWEVEHHFLEEYSHSSAPEVFLAAASQRTKRIRLGHGIVQTPPPFNHPARVAERIAMLDLVSGGRADFGTGESSSEAELGGFLHRSRAEAGDVGGGPARRAAVPDRDAVHRSRRRVRHHAAAQRRAEAGAEAAPAGVGRVQPARHHPPRRAERDRRARVRVHRSRGGAALDRPTTTTTLADEGVPIGDAVNANVACVTTFMCHDDEEEALRRGLEGANFFGYSLAHYYVFGRHHPGTHRRVGRVPARSAASTATTPRRWRPRPRDGDRLGAKVVQEGGIVGLRGAVGTPDQIRDYLRRYEECGVDQVIFCVQAGKNRHEHIMESLELFGTRGAARVHGPRREAAARQGAAARAGRSTPVMARKPADRPSAAAGRRLRVPRHPPWDGRPRRRRRLPPVARRLRRHDRPGGGGELNDLLDKDPYDPSKVARDSLVFPADRAKPAQGRGGEGAHRDASIEGGRIRSSYSTRSGDLRHSALGLSVSSFAFMGAASGRRREQLVRRRAAGTRPTAENNWGR